MRSLETQSEHVLSDAKGRRLRIVGVVSTLAFEVPDNPRGEIDGRPARPQEDAYTGVQHPPYGSAKESAYSDATTP